LLLFLKCCVFLFSLHYSGLAELYRGVCRIVLFLIDSTMINIRLFFLLFGLSLFSESVLAQSIDEVYQRLTLEQKVAKLFVADAERKSTALQPLGYVSSKSLAGDVFPTVLKGIDFSEGVSDGLFPSFPSDDIIASCGDKVLIDNLVQSFFGYKPSAQFLIAGGYAAMPSELNIGLDVPNPDAFLYFNTGNTERTLSSTAALIPLPSSFLALKPSKNVVAVRGRELSAAPAWDLGVKHTDNIGFSFNDLLMRPYLFKTENLGRDVERVIRAYNSNEINKLLFEKRVKWAMHWARNCLSTTKKTATQLATESHVLARRKVYEAAVVLARNGGNHLPLTDLRSIQLIFCDHRTTKSQSFLAQIDFHCPSAMVSNGFDLFDQDLSGIHQKTLGIVMCDDLPSLPSILLKLHKAKTMHPKTEWLLLFGGEVNEAGFVANDYSVFEAVAMVYGNDAFAWDCAVQTLFGGIGFKGNSLFELKGLSQKNVQQMVAPSRMKRGIPEEVGMNAKTLDEINDLVNEAIASGATPGAQVTVARHGVVVFHRNFGKTTYSGTEPVRSSHLYDIASITKILTTTPVVMKLLDDKKLELNGQLKKYLPETAETNKGTITISELLKHKSGLPPNMPTFYNFIDRSVLNGSIFNKNKSDNYPTRVDERLFANKDVVLRKELFSSSGSSNNSVQVAKNLYFDKIFGDSLYQIMLAMPVDRVKIYKYSDLGIGFLQKVAERIYKAPLDRLADSLLFSPMCLTSICFNPLTKFPLEQIVPTEDEQLFRKQLLQGYVHDPAAALMGGVAGHAGAFANAGDVARIMQMFLDGGTYGGVQLFSPETVKLFTSRTDASVRRGLGFDKPDSSSIVISPVCVEASSQSFGHTGFTGTIAWADPQNGLVFVFLSNRIHTHVWNKKLMQMDIRAKCMSAAYRSVSNAK
jgi:CubicO group peptidase (beta-lactamase class C family)